jgi:hypothetical protein
MNSIADVKIPLIFVSQSRGEFTADDGKKIEYNKVEFSDGLRSFKLSAPVGKIFDFKEGEKVEAKLSIFVVSAKAGQIVKLEVQEIAHKA